MIKEVMEHYYPGWEPPEDDGRIWIPTECPVHGDDNASASISYENNAYNCHACGYRGDVYAIIMREEDVHFGEAVGIAEGIAERSGIEVPRSSTRKPGRGVSKPTRFGSL